MAGACDAHVTIAGNLFALLRSHVRSSGCRGYMSDMKARIETLDIFYYPDVMVTCDDRDLQLDYFKRYPCLIVEVLSDSTESRDRGDKFADYRELSTLQEYVLISQSRQRVECFRRNAESQWVLVTYRPNQQLRLETIHFSCSVNDIYEDVGNEE